MAHWIVRVARDQDLTGAAQLDVATSAPIDVAWRTVERACGIDGDELCRVVAKAFRTRVADLPRAEATAVKLLPDSVARRFGVFPVRDLDRSLEVATADPANPDAEQEIAFASGRAAVLLIAHPEAIASAIASAYTPEAATAAILSRVEDDMAEAVEVGLSPEEQPESVTEEEVASGPVVRLTNLILAEAVTRGASDIHIQPTGRGGVVRYRTDGVLSPNLQMPLPVLLRVVSRIKIMGDLDIADRLRPQDGRARILVAKRPYDLRISTVPTRNAEKAVIRILDTQASTTLADTGIQHGDLARIRNALSHRDGIFVVSGPTGSGKTTTLYGALRDIATEDINIMTVEDPVEYELPGLTQIQVDPKQGVTFASALRAILRQDPDAIFVGEIRDPETAEVAVQASLTGHLVLATLHANDAVGSLRRFLDLGLDAPTLAEVLRGSLAQRLVRRVCPYCAAAVNGDATAEEAQLSEQLGVRPRMRAIGCERCAGTGYMGRMPVTEFLQPSATLAALVANAAPGAQLHAQAVQDGMRSLLDSGRARVQAGETTLQEVHRVLGTARDAEDAGGAASRAAATPRRAAVDASGPVADSATATTRVSDPPAESGETRVLLVDDDGTLRSIARSLLEKEGYCVEEANDGSEALARLSRGERFTLMVLDLDMPMLGGREVLKAVRASLATASLPVLVLTGTNEQDAEIQLLEQGADDYMRKPIEPKRFLLRVKAAVRRARG
jgi:type II secretory ATPase GspE/PulE/Tfp pilus assembly ATPase PilB-like protein/ActR/RegA family two-component response regulator